MKVRYVPDFMVGIEDTDKRQVLASLNISQPREEAEKSP